ncbi:hypothetical protein [uncultured Tenacibaculum sp.]|uniref:nuclear transport factor 2 family protein n=1 Tax=uncultured Tenacibaculum sp. TaxID=174713 RepID=UPI00262199ED|nr:hypothetical protein [uncultured Tenacibaculum sp.]
MSTKIQNAKRLYLEGIRDGNIQEALDKYTGDSYTQHSAGVGNNKEGFLKFFIPFIKRNPVRDIQIIRAFEDGQYVFVHVYQSLNNGEAKWVTADFFDTDAADRMIEHWDAIQAYEEDTVSGRTMVDGPTEIEDLDKTEANKEHIRKFVDEILIGRNIENITKYVSTEQYDQHNPKIGDGIEGLLEHIQKNIANNIKSGYKKLHLLVGQGNFVSILSHVIVNDVDFAFIDIFRLKDGLIVEHWDVQEKILPKNQWENSGKF